MLHFDVILSSLAFVLPGIIVTLEFTILSLVCGLPLGIFLAFCKISPICVLKKFAEAYTSVFRGTPLLLQLGLIFFATPQLTGYPISAFEAGILAFSLNSAAYTSEIIRGGIQSLDPGQWEVARVLGIPYRHTLLKIILPQATRTILPTLVNEMINLLKESAIVCTIGEADLMKRAQMMSMEKFLYFEPYIVAGFYYFIMVMIISHFGKKLEKKLAYA
ncbi:MAG: amino acid ABC transporter permease [Alphaproteobacteria bacterium]|nr:amino acid ABC transporter permease [Alphaproteobacteria bacterium]